MFCGFLVRNKIAQRGEKHLLQEGQEGLEGRSQKRLRRKDMIYI